MHIDDINKYEGPPCDFCQKTMFVGTCTHRPHKYPILPDFNMTEEEKAEFQKVVEKIQRESKKA